MRKIIPCLWFQNQVAEEAVDFYVSLFGNSKRQSQSYHTPESAKASGMPEGSILTVDFQLEGAHFFALNGNADSPFTPAVSFFVNCETPEEIDRLWQNLSEGGTALMPLDSYPFSEKYGWVQDKFGISWQLILANRAQKIAPCLLFVGKRAGKAEDAMKLYTSMLPNSQIVSLTRYTADEGPDAGRIKHAIFSLNGQEFTAMDSGMAEHTFSFTPAISFMVTCDTQAEIDEYWAKLTNGGEEIECGWLTDPYGVTWQITPAMMYELLYDPDPEKTRRAMKAMMGMKKLDIETIQKAVG